MEVLLTGGAGFIGSHISKQLLNQGHSVTIYDNLSRSNKDNIDARANFIQGDISKMEEKTKLTQALRNTEAVIHLASLISVEESTQNPEEFVNNNVLGSVLLLEAIRGAGVPKVIFSSSACVYGNSDQLPFKEDAPTCAANPYGATKIAVESFMQSYHNIFGLDATILRYFNPYGPLENHQPDETHAIPNIIKSALLKKPIPLYWNGQQKRDFIYIEDLAQAHIAVLPLKGWNIFNVGTESGVKVMDVVDQVENILGYDIEKVDMGERTGDVAASYASSSLLKKKTGWQPQHTLEDGLKKTIKWFEKVV